MQRLGSPSSTRQNDNTLTRNVFLGILLDSIRRRAQLPRDKLEDYATSIQQHLASSTITRKQLETLVGKLSFAAAVVPARAFLRRLIEKVNTVKQPHHYIRFTEGIISDLHTWLSFLEGYNSITYFRALRLTDSTEINMAYDASIQGFGACYGSSWIQCPYPTHWQKFHITILELFPIYVLIAVFRYKLKNSCIRFFCDNQALTDIVNKQTSKNKIAMKIVLVMMLVNLNISLHSEHIPGIQNTLPDKISRFQVTPELLRKYHMKQEPTTIPAEFMPENFIAS